jgi:hypothetical protein
MARFSKVAFYVLVITKWLPLYFRFRLRNKKDPIHILFCLVDHFEPGAGGASIKIERERMRTLLTKYPLLAGKHKDFFGNIPKRTWFFPPHDHRNNNLRDLVSLCEKGYGEIELHLHHGKTQPDTSENLTKTLLQCILEYGHFGIFGSQNGRKRYAFIHGDWALDNSRNGKYCGVNNEIQILNQTGCYADFTFPSLNESNPKQINSIYYAYDNPCKPKSYNRGHPVSKFGKETGDLMIIQGPVHPFFLFNRITGLRCPGDEISGKPRVTNRRVDFWVSTGIHIRGKKDWLIIKTHTHGATCGRAVLGEEIDGIFDYLETRYNDGTKYILHYVTARELFNIIKAVEAGETGTNPEEYRDYLIKRPKYDSTQEISKASDILKNLIAKTYAG